MAPFFQSVFATDEDEGLVVELRAVAASEVQEGVTEGGEREVGAGGEGVAEGGEPEFAA